MRNILAGVFLGCSTGIDNNRRFRPSGVQGEAPEGGKRSQTQMRGQRRYRVSEGVCHLDQGR